MPNELLLNALRCTNKERPPIWIMRQAGRYLPEYRAIRAKHSFMEMCHTPELACEVTLLPIQLLEMDAAILFSDILVVAEAFGVGLRFEEGIGPIIERPITSAEQIDQLPAVQAEEQLSYVADSIKLLRNVLKVPLLGFSGAPFTVASYMIEGGSSKDFKKTKQLMFREPAAFHKLLQKIADVTIDYLKVQIKAGVQAVQIFDSWAHILGHVQFREFSLRYLEYIVRAIEEVPVLLFCRGSSVFASQLAEITPSGISVDWQSDITKMRNQIPSTIALQGNLDPDILYGSRQTIEKEAKRILKGMQGDGGFIFNLGHGIHPDTPVDAVKTLIHTVKQHE